MAHIKLDPSVVKATPHEANPMMVSYNVEFTEVTGGTFWKSYTPGQIAGTEPFQLDLSSGNFMEIQKGMMQYYPPSASASWQRLSALPGSGFPAPGPPRPITILTAPPAVLPPKALTVF